MRLSPDDYFHLTYCTNIHPGETWPEVRSNLKEYLPHLKANLSPEQPFGIGLRLSDQASRQLMEGRRLADLKAWLDANDFYVYTMNGFPYGSFHREVVKDQVYAPDWRKKERVDYTVRLAHILAELLPEGLDGGVSTSPVSYKLWLEKADWAPTFEQASKHFAEVAAELAKIREQTGKLIHIDIEPEPHCLIENTAETVAFFNDWLRPVGGQHLAELRGIEPNAAEEQLLEHIQVCYDTCHFAVEYEEPEEVFSAFKEAGIQIGKVQISSALQVTLPEETDKRAQLRERLLPFSEAVYLHQVVERQEEKQLHRYADLDVALVEIGSQAAKEWRIHYHVPIFAERFGSLNSTQQDIVKALEQVYKNRTCRHLEIETYTWDVLPEELKLEIVPSIQREYEWVLAQFD